MRLLSWVPVVIGVHFLPAAVMAAGINLSWDDCGAAGSSFKFFDCNSNLGQDVLVASAEAPADLDSVSGFLATIFIKSAGPLPEWWRFKSPTDFTVPIHPQCRDSSAVRLVVDPSSVSCPTILGDFTRSDRFLGYSSEPEYHGDPTLARVRVYGQLMNDVRKVTLSGEGYLFSLVVTHRQTVGDGSCPGCDLPVCIVFTEVVYFRDGTDDSRTDPITTLNRPGFSGELVT